MKKTPTTPIDIKVRLDAYLRKNHPEICRHWFDEIEPVGIDGGTLNLLVREPVRRQYLQRTCLVQFTEAAQAITGCLLAVRFVGDENIGAVKPLGDSASVGATTELDEQLVLSPDYTFETFVVGPSNRLAHAAAVAVSANLEGHTTHSLYMVG